DGLRFAGLSFLFFCSSLAFASQHYVPLELCSMMAVEGAATLNKGLFLPQSSIERDKFLTLVGTNCADWVTTSCDTTKTGTATGMATPQKNSAIRSAQNRSASAATGNCCPNSLCALNPGTCSYSYGTPSCTQVAGPPGQKFWQCTVTATPNSGCTVQCGTPVPTPGFPTEIDPVLF
ncbi:MAG: hypothetical protein KDD53_03215, partial [Bdellovibrionales bacterium]|nr:hypothetical protein [Bdellovibrionales bacterium]